MQKENSFIKINKFFLIGFFSVIFFLLLTSQAQAAQLFVNSSKSTVGEGETFRVRIGVNTEGLFINNSEAIVSFPSSLVQVIGVDSGNSIFDLWVEKPAFSNTAGTVTFNGGIATPGFSGENGTLFWVTLRAKKSGTANFLLQGASVRANDGLGTNVLSVTRNTNVNIIPASDIKIEKPSKEDTIDPDLLFATFEVNDLGESYIALSAHDNIGIDYFSISIDGATDINIEAIEDSAIYLLPKDLSSEVHYVDITAFDKAGNFKKQKIELPKKPEIIDFTKNILVGESAHLVGSTGLPNNEFILAIVYPSKRLETYSVLTDSSGSFDLNTEVLSQAGKYTIWIQKKEIGSVDGVYSNKVIVNVEATKFQNILSKVIEILPGIIGSLLVVCVLFVSMYRFGYRLVKIAKK